jgi:hypothetical protein
MGVIRELCEEHRLLAGQAAQLLAIVSADAPDAAAVAAIRWRMSQALSEHCARERAEVYDVLAAAGDAEAVALAAEFTRVHGDLAGDFAAWVIGWPVLRVSREWAAFRAETCALVARLRHRMAREEAELYPLAPAAGLARAA